MQQPTHQRFLAGRRLGGSLFSSLVMALLLIAGVVVMMFGGSTFFVLRSFESESQTISKKLAEDAMAKDLNVARSILDQQSARVEALVRDVVNQSGFVEAIEKGDNRVLGITTQVLRGDKRFHFFTIVDGRGVVIARVATPNVGDDLSSHPLVRRALSGGRMTGIWSEEESFLEKEGLAQSTRIQLVATPHSRETSKSEETRAMITGAVFPIKNSSGRVVGAVIAGFSLSRDSSVVDQIRHTLYRTMESAGTATIFLDDVRIATNVTSESGERALGTRGSETVYETVIRDGKTFQGRAFVVRDWYMAAYEPIRDVSDRVIGMLYVGVLEKPFTQPWISMVARIERHLILYVVLAAALSGVASIGLSLYLARGLVRPMTALATSVERIAAGDLTVVIPESDRKDELGVLQATLKSMASNLSEMVRTARLGIKEMSANSMQISVTAKQAQATAAGQASAVSEVGSTMDEIGATSRLVMDRAQEVVETSERAVEGGQRGLEAVAEAQRGVELVSGIIDIVDSVNELAEQSNVLAVNAAIEAARAGDQGKGFAVVAGEVRNLAGQSKKAAKQIRDIVERAGASGAAIGRAREVIGDLASVLEESARKARQIAAAAGQQAAGMKQMTEAMEHVVRGGRDTAEGAKQLESAVSNLSNLASQLDQKVVRYHV